MEDTQVSKITVTPTPPKGSDEEFLAEMKQKCSDMVKDVIAEGDSRTVVTKFDNLGSNQTEILSQKISLLDERLNSDLEKATAKKTPTASNLDELSVTLDMLNPQRIQKEKFLGIIPYGSLPWGANKAISKLKTRYSSNKDKIEGTIENLQGCREALIRDNSQLEQLYLNVQEAKKLVIAQAYLGELLIEAIEAEIEKTDDDKVKANLNKLLSRIYARTQDLRISEQVDTQFEAAISQMIDNNVELKDAVERTVNVARPLLTVVMTLATARARQKAVQRSVETTRESLGSLLEAGAAESKQTAEEVAELANKPVIALEKVEAAYNSYLEAMDITQKAQMAGIEGARKAITETRTMTERLDSRIEEFNSDTAKAKQLEA